MGFESVAAGTALILKQLIVESETTDEYADFGAGHTVRGYSAILQSLPRRPQQETLLRIEQVRLARRDAEELSVELIDLAEEPASTGNHLPDFRRVWIVLICGVPACFWNCARSVGFTA